MGFRLGFATGFGVFIVVGCCGASVGTYLFVLAAGVGSDNKSQSPAMKISEPGIAKIGWRALKIFTFTKYQKETIIRKIPSRSLGTKFIFQSPSIFL